jgi:anti-anti-sigma factor
MIEIHVSVQERVAVVQVQGRIDSSTANELGAALSHTIEDGYHQLVLDIGGVDYMSSAGLREMVAALKKVRNRGGDMRVAQVNERVFEVLEMSGLNTIFQIFDSPVAAIRSF